jgi:hypothetical protein
MFLAKIQTGKEREREARGKRECRIRIRNLSAIFGNFKKLALLKKISFN